MISTHLELFRDMSSEVLVNCCNSSQELKRQQGGTGDPRHAAQVISLIS